MAALEPAPLHAHPHRVRRASQPLGGLGKRQPRRPVATLSRGKPRFHPLRDEVLERVEQVGCEHGGEPVAPGHGLRSGIEVLHERAGEQPGEVSVPDSFRRPFSGSPNNGRDP